MKNRTDEPKAAASKRLIENPSSKCITGSMQLVGVVTAHMVHVISNWYIGTLESRHKSQR
ncbi:hypothetical protein M514_00028 [Trichuris suis]|uniref:Uncharacterized protein n=1 Tax=Trichuris suis TaxID=68888 RepID=A0A085NTU1_9BILA|nr:hypothetical protein M513_00028 [Trichuris suis]KFD72887.1 hypothetical protein M514_00028 [Trichuris suis]